ncbi:hypothetical protein [Microbacterium caowuchunii]|uniref:Exo-alpha-sialidase n=1 Tax=Microbacterium caowuchunii TaxID=2614638 RepID=A0A5N0TCT4_9MICO|nr:hypothetical protein [Microbacterium caowuchunii]KAA9132903.1 hypothetical protein F6B40_09980 [Microbacterium caowuchunii]
MLVAVLAVVVIVLVVLAFQRTRGGAPVEQSPRPIPSFSPTPDVTPSPTATPAALPIAAPGAEERFLSVGSGALWRATAGACGETAPLLERSTDDGRTWNDVTPRYLGIGQILSLNAFAGTEAQLVALMGADCEVQGLRTFTQGRFWEPNDDVLAGATYVLPDGAEVVTPSGSVETPCTHAWGARAVAGTVGLICDGTAFVREGSAWEPAGRDVVAIAASADGLGTAALDGDCDGLMVTAEATPVCVASAASARPAAITLSGTDILLWAGDTITREPAP